MIPTLADIVSAVQGAWKLMLWDRDGLDRFDMTIEGFWRSFFAPLAALPFFILMQVARLAMVEETRTLDPDALLPDFPSTGIHLALESTAYVADVALFPILMILVVRRMELAARYIPFIIAWNWVNALLVGLLAIPHLLYVAGAIGLASIYGFQVIIMGLSIFCLYFTTWAALETPPLVATVILGLGLILGLILSELVTLAIL